METEHDLIEAVAASLGCPKDTGYIYDHVNNRVIVVRSKAECTGTMRILTGKHAERRVRKDP